ncbi:MAG: tetratricopeptide repeat protein [Blastocatellia bacterium]
MKQLLLPVLLTLLWSSPVIAQEPGDPLAEARALINGGKPAAAITKLQSLPQPNDPRVAQLLGVAYYNSNDHVRAIERFTAALDKLPKDGPAWRETVQLLGLSHYILGHLAEAIPFLEQTRAWLPNNNELTYALGMASVYTRQPGKAREAFGRMYRVAPDSAAAHLLTAQMMFRAELEELAEAELKQALEKEPRLPQANYLLGQIAIYKGRLDDGIALMEKELAVNPGNANAHYKIGDALTRQLKWDEAIVALQKSVWLNPFYSGPYILLGKSYLKKRELASAEGMLKHAIQFDPNNKSAHYLLAQTYQQSNRPEDAKREFAIAAKLQGSADSTEKGAGKEP